VGDLGVEREQWSVERLGERQVGGVVCREVLAQLPPVGAVARGLGERREAREVGDRLPGSFRADRSGLTQPPYRLADLDRKNLWQVNDVVWVVELIRNLLTGLDRSRSSTTPKRRGRSLAVPLGPDDWGRHHRGPRRWIVTGGARGTRAGLADPATEGPCARERPDAAPS